MSAKKRNQIKIFFKKKFLSRFGVSAGKRDQIEIFFKKKFLSKIDVDLIIWSRTFIISKKNFLSIWSLFSALTPYVPTKFAKIHGRSLARGFWHVDTIIKLKKISV